jgi:hypothetical protein
MNVRPLVLLATTVALDLGLVALHGQRARLFETPPLLPHSSAAPEGW